MSLISASRCRPARSTRSSGSISSSRFKSRASSCSISVTPMIAFSGVRSSCDMLARNCDLCWLATSSCSPFSWISLKSRAFWMASTDCAAKVCRSSTQPRTRRPGGLSVAHRRRPRLTLSSRIHRHGQAEPGSHGERGGRAGARRTFRSSWTSGSEPGGAWRAARPIVPSPSRGGRARSASTSSALHLVGHPQVEGLCRASYS